MQMKYEAGLKIFVAQSEAGRYENLRKELML
jgi:hypothetical protein